MAYPWFRLFCDTPHSPKLRVAARRAGVPMHAALAVWIAMLCHAGGRRDAAERGSLVGWSDEAAGVALDMDEATVARLRLEAMQGLLLEGERIAGWDRRQAEAPSTARVREWRQRQKDKRRANVAKHDETLRGVTPPFHATVETTCNAMKRADSSSTYTPPPTPKNLIQNSRESLFLGGVGGVGGESDSVAKHDETLRNVPPAKPPRSRASAKTAMKRDWRPSREEELFAHEMGLDAAAVVEDFRDYFLGKGEKLTDWDARFRRWVREEVRRRRAVEDGPPGSAMSRPAAVRQSFHGQDEQARLGTLDLARRIALGDRGEA